MSKEFATSLLFCHVLTLLIFTMTCWSRYSSNCHAHLLTTRCSGLSLLQFIKTCVSYPSQPIQPTPANVEILTILFTSNIIGTLFARSLHYQFYSWTAWTMPFLLWRTGWNPMIQVSTWVLGEWAWNVFPSTWASSLIAVGVYAAVLIGVWSNWDRDIDEDK